ncbi:MAG: TIGR00730 family Rossman fold protein [Rhizobiales bacterium]|nr:TIGR00730 family Rossman fold protein [Hyphomicrobiales bacterium]MBN9009221.1 TIGR00730 family Rossman fold protein [Hyphomicrobiales bacterium]
MAQLTSICVYCGSNAGADPAYAEGARILGKAMAAQGIRLVYGGGAVGLMGIIARSVLDAGGNVLGVIPQFLKDREVMLREASELIVTADMHERKRIMFEHADSFLALPGGIGTLEELVEIMTWAQLDRHRKPIIVANINGFWDPLTALFGRMTEAGFLTKAFLANRVVLPVRFVDTIGEVIPAIREGLASVERADLAGEAPAHG